MECISCDGVGCEDCIEGRVQISGCPKKYCREVVPAISLIDLFQKGLPPIAGGTLDQSVWFIEAAKILGYEEAQAKSEATQ
jgi:hypothetical protein